MWLRHTASMPEAGKAMAAGRQSREERRRERTDDVVGDVREVEIEAVIVESRTVPRHVLLEMV